MYVQIDKKTEIIAIKERQLYMSSIQIKDLSFAYEAGGKLILKDINTEIGEGEFVCILGQSGCGKSTLLRLWQVLKQQLQERF